MTARFGPMLARAATEPPTGPGWVFEAKYDGVRALAFAASASASLVSRNGNDKSAQFPEVVAALRALAAKVGRPLVLDGEIVALDAHGEPARFQDVQGRIHAKGREAVRLAEETPAAFVAFDLLLDGDDVLVSEPLVERRKRLATLLRKAPDAILAATPLTGSGRAALALARRRGWEGVIAKRLDAPYEPGKRSGSWMKVKAEAQQEFVVGGWTEPRNSREHVGALLIGTYDDEGRFVFAGAVGTGFTRRSLADVYARLSPIERRTPPFVNPPSTREPAHWVTPSLVAEVRFNEWTRDGVLRHPVFLGLRDDKDPLDVRREALPASATAAKTATKHATKSATARRPGARGASKKTPSTATRARVRSRRAVVASQAAPAPAARPHSASPTRG